MQRREQPLKLVLKKRNKDIAMDIWVVEREKFSDNDVSIDLFESEKDAFVQATNDALDEFLSLNCDDPDSGSHDTFGRFKTAVRAKDYQRALDIYNDWNCDFDFEQRFSICVYNKTLKSASAANNSSHVSVVPAKSQTKFAKPDVPCKQCGRNVNEAEDICWYCGCSNPAIH